MDIRKLRTRLRLTQKQFGQILNVTQSTVANWEYQITRPDRPTREKILELIINPSRLEIPGFLIRQERLRRHLTQSQMARRLRFSVSLLAQYESGRKICRGPNAQIWARVIRSRMVRRMVTELEEFLKHVTMGYDG